jgi:hypothetical protein
MNRGLKMTNSLQSKWPLLIMGIAVGALAMWGIMAFQGTKPVKPEIIEGYSSGTNFDETALGISPQPGGGGNSYSIIGAWWREFGGNWHNTGAPPSLAQPNVGQKVRLGIVWVNTSKNGPGGSYPVAVWLDVLSP